MGWMTDNFGIEIGLEIISHSRSQTLKKKKNDMNCFEIVKRKRMKVRGCISIEYFWDRIELKKLEDRLKK